jgi:acyl dehydratase
MNNNFTDKKQKILDMYLNKLNEVIHVGPWVEITQDRINKFAEVTGDIQWIHTDLERAKKESPYKSTIAHGYLTLSMLPFLTESNHPDFFNKNYPGMKMRVNYGLNKVRFPSPVKTGTSIRAKTIPINIEIIKNTVEITYKIIVEVSDNDKPACVAEYVARLYE